jgi:hypothetical protein
MIILLLHPGMVPAFSSATLLRSRLTRVVLPLMQHRIANQVTRMHS